VKLRSAASEKLKLTKRPFLHDMNNNDILRRLRYAFDFSNKQSVELFGLDPSSTAAISMTSFKAKLAKEDEEDFSPCSDLELKAFLDGLIVLKRGLRELLGPPTDANYRLTKNDILKKLRIAMNFKEQDMLDTLKSGGSKLSKAELSALFRNPKHKHYRACGNQVLRNFIKGLTLNLRNETA
jgi:uncharacterized protein YehS (DUF1456 family)